MMKKRDARISDEKKGCTSPWWKKGVHVSVMTIGEKVAPEKGGTCPWCRPKGMHVSMVTLTWLQKGCTLTGSAFLVQKGMHVSLMAPEREARRPDRCLWKSKGVHVSGRKKGMHVGLVKPRFEKGCTSPWSGRREKGVHVAGVGGALLAEQKP